MGAVPGAVMTIAKNVLARLQSLFTESGMDSSLIAYLQPPRLYAVLAAAGAALAGVGLLVHGRKRKSDAERERERRLAVNASGRMTDGTVTEALFLGSDLPDSLLLFYRYLVAGVEYSAAQDVSSLREILPRPNYLPGEAITIKYDPHRPPNSIVVCEQWSGLRSSGNGAARVSAMGRQAVKS
jgi:hypothetical protein